MDDPIYLDHNATTPVLDGVVDAMLPYLRRHFGNPSSSHTFGRAAHDGVETARAQVASLLGCAADEVLFTSGGTESNNLAIRGVAAARPRRDAVVTSTIEHPAVEQPCRLLATRGHDVRRAPVDGEGRVDEAALAGLLDERVALVRVMLANNETGALQPIASVAAAAHGVGATVHTDAAQAVGKVPARVDELGVDLLTVAGHKLYAPKGVGALYVRRGTPLEPCLRGAHHEADLRPGTENVPYIVGLGAACAIAEASLDAEAARQRALVDRLWTQLAAGIPGLTLHGPLDARLPNTLNVGLPGGVRGSAVLDATPAVAATTGSACHEGGERPSPVLRAMGIEPDAALGALRLSVGRHTTAAEIDRAASALIAAFTACANST